MRIFVGIIFIFFQIALFSQQKIKVLVSYTNSYCGGARPTNEILEKYKTPHKLADFKIKLVGKKTFKVKTDTTGYFTCKLNPGNYFIFLTEEKNKTIPANYNPDCHKMLLASYGELHIEKGKLNYEVILSFPCDPCQLSNKP